MTTTNGRQPSGAWRTTMVALGACALGACGSSEVAGPQTTAAEAAGPESSAAALAQDSRHNPNPALFPKNARPYGRSLEFWSEQWWRWIYSVPAANNPFLHPGLDSNQGQSGPVFFLVAGDRTNTVPRHRAIAVLPSSIATLYPCPDPTFVPAPGQSLFDFLISSILPAHNAVVEVDATLDGQPLTDLLSYQATSDDLTFVVGDLSLQTDFDNCITGAPQPAVASSFIFIIKPLEPGMHVLTTKVVNQAGRVFTHTQNLDVQ